MFNCTSSWNWKEVPIMMVLRVILKGILKACFRLISSLMKSQSNFGKLTKNVKQGLDSSCPLHLGQRIFGVLPILCIAGFKGREKWICLYQINNTYLSVRVFLKPFIKFFSPDIRTENMVSFKEVWLWNEFERFVVFSTVRLKGEVNFFIREFLEVLHS